MELSILDTTFKRVDIVDVFESLIWTDRYSAYGDFEIFAPASSKLLQNVRHDYYLWHNDTEHVMIVEDIQITSDFESGSKMTITGRSLESILERRIIWKKTILSGNLQNGIKKLLDENIILATDTNRRIQNFIFLASTDPIITALTIEAQYTGDNLYEVIKYICDINGIGFKVVLNTSNQFVFSLYSGVDRTYDQIANPYVIFSPNFENLLNSNYLESNKTLRTVTLVAGEEYDTTKDDVEASLDALQAGGSTYVDVGLGVVRKTVTVVAPGAAISDISRREMFSDARDITQIANGVALSDAQYDTQLVHRGEAELVKNALTQSFEGEVETTNTFIFGLHYFMGDKVQIVNEYDFESVVRVVEVVKSHSVEGETVLPTFSKVQ